MNAPTPEATRVSRPRRSPRPSPGGRGRRRAHAVDAALLLVAGGSFVLTGQHGAAPGGNVALTLVALAMLGRSKARWRPALLVLARAVATLALVGFGLSLDRYTTGAGEPWGDSMAVWLVAACAAGLANCRLTELDAKTQATAAAQRHQELLDCIGRSSGVPAKSFEF